MNIRQIVIDTETTGLEVKNNHRIIEIGAIALTDRYITKEHFHVYLNPQRESDPNALAVHGLTESFLSSKPLFSAVIEQFLDFIKGAELIIHNAAFDVGFLNHELQIAGTHYGQIANYCQITDTLQLARRLHPGQRNSLDALCKRYGVNNSHRALHGALLDAELLARVYLQMTSGQSVLFDEMPLSKALSQSYPGSKIDLSLPVITASDEERIAHKARLQAITKSAGQCLWECH